MSWTLFPRPKFLRSRARRPAQPAVEQLEDRLVPTTTPAVSWAMPAAITYGTPLGAAQLDATATVPGTFAYTPGAGTVLAVGAQTLAATFTPTDTADYATVTDSVKLYVDPPVPTNLVATPGNAEVSLSWTASAGATSYALYRGTSSGGETEIAYGLKGTSFTDTGLDDNLNSGPALSNGATYFYEVRAVGAGDTQSGLSKQASATPEKPLATPTLTWATPAAITFGTVLSAAQLDATASVAGTFAYTPVAGTVLGAGTHTLTVTFTPTDTTDYTTATDSVTLTVNKATPTVTWATPAAITAGTALSATQLDATASVAGTFVYTPSAGTLLAAGTQTLDVAFTPTDTTDYTTASASVTLAVNSSGAVPAVPTGLTVTEGNAQVSLSWTAASGATSYDIYQGTSGGTESLLASGVATTSYTSTGLSNGTTYYYEVSGVNATGQSGRSGQMAAIPQGGPAAPTNLTASAGNGLVTLSWTAPAGATSYNIYRSSGLTIVGFTGTTFVDMTVTPGTTYSYRVCADGTGGLSPQAGPVSATPQAATLTAPTNLSATAGIAQVALSWTASAGATGYSIFRSTSSSITGTLQSAIPIASTAGTSFTDTGLSPGTTYYYWVGATNAAGGSGLSSSVSAAPQAPPVPVPAAPTGLTAGAGNGLVALAWTASANATSYNLYRGTSSGGETLVGSGLQGAAFVDTGLSNGTTYYYKVCAVDAGGSGNLSSEVSATPQAASPADWFSANLPDPGLQALARVDFNRDGSITYNDMLGLLGQAATETAGGTMSTAVVQSLQAMATSSGAASLNMLPSVAGLTNNLVDGGVTSSSGAKTTPLTANSTTGAQLQSLIDQWFLGEDLPNSDGVSYWLTSGTLFNPATGIPTYTDVAQGAEGDCWLIASFDELAYKQPGIIQSSFTDDGLIVENAVNVDVNGSAVPENGVGVHVWTFCWYDHGTPEYMTLNNELPMGGSYYASPKDHVLWGALMEKAYASIWGNNYGSLNGGLAARALPLETGSTTNAGLNFGSVSESNYISAIKNADDLMTVASYSTINGLVGGHDYAVLNTWTDSTGTQWIQLFNPWDSDEPPPTTYTYLTTSGHFAEDGETVVKAAPENDPALGTSTSGILPMIVSHAPVLTLPASSSPVPAASLGTGAGSDGQAGFAYEPLWSIGHAPQSSYLAESLASVGLFDFLDGLDKPAGGSGR